MPILQLFKCCGDLTKFFDRSLKHGLVIVWRFRGEDQILASNAVEERVEVLPLPRRIVCSYLC